MKSMFIFIFLGSYIQVLLAVQFKNPHEMLHYVSRFLPSSPVILEAGGNRGEDTNRMKSIWPTATMHVFEPLPSSFKVMLMNTEHLSNVFCYPYALTNYSGETNFYIDMPNNAASSIGYPVKWNEHEFDKTPINVPCTTIDEWAKLNHVDHVDFMWLDMESHELYALEHALTIMSTVKAIYTEVAYVPVRQGSCLYHDLKRFLKMHGFMEVWKSNSGRFGNALFLKSNLLEEAK